jgi:hypothetical protein
MNDRKANIRYHRCHTLGHYANECPKARVQFTDDQDNYLEDKEEWNNNEEEVYEANPEDVSGESLVAQRLCIAPPTKENWKRHDIFKTLCSINGKKCNIIIESGS